MKKYLFFYILLCCNAAIIMAQQTPQLPEKVQAKLPQILSRNDTKTLSMKDDLYPSFSSGKDWGQKKTVNSYWDVFSDRQNNITYATPDKKGKECGSLGFGDEVRIAEIKNDMALVFKKNSNEQFPAIRKDAKALGWVPMENLLLWRTCPADTRGVQRKGLIAINLNEGHFTQELRYNPESDRYKDDLSMDMNFYYVMKETPDQEWALLSTGYTFDNATKYGWVHKSAYTMWNQRTCLEYNWEHSYVTKNHNELVEVYADETGKTSVCQWKLGTKNTLGNEYYQYRMHPNLLRYPVLGQPNENTGMIHCTAFADRSGKATSDLQYSNVGSDVNKKKLEMRKLNIILAVEASTMMKKYMPTIKSALSMCKDLTAKQFNVRVGLVLYRNQGTGIAASDIVPLGKYDDEQLMMKLQESVANTALTGERYTSLAQAIETASNRSKMGFTEEQSNLVLVIGYHGADDNSWEKAKLLQAMQNNNIQLASIQVMRDGSSCGRYFSSMLDLVYENAKNNFAKRGAEVQPFEGLNTKNGYRLTAINEHGRDATTHFASLRYNKIQEQEMQPADLKSNIQNTINNFSKTVDKCSEYFDHALVDIGFDEKFLIGILGKDGFKKWKTQKAISAYSGYAKIKDLESNDNWRAILYLSRPEFSQLLNDLEKVYNAAKQKNGDRKILEGAMRKLLKAQMGDDVEDKIIDAMSPEKMDEYIYGIVNLPSNSMNKRITKKNLKQLMNSKVVDDEEYFQILNEFAKKYEKLKKYPEEFSLKVVNKGTTMTYYWIPLNDLP